MIHVQTQMILARKCYEGDLAVYPNYHDGKPRPNFDKLSVMAQKTWIPKSHDITKRETNV